MNQLKVIANEMLPVYQNENGEKFVNARELHEQMLVGKVFAAWIQERIEKYGFIEGDDFWVSSAKTKGRPKKEYFLTIKSALIVEQNEGRNIVINKDIAVIKPKRREIEFGEWLEATLTGITNGSSKRWNGEQNSLNIIKQARFDSGKYRVDFVIPGFSLAIEYDETHHNHKYSNDIERMDEINKSFWLLEGFEEHELPPKWIRVKEGKEIDGIREIMTELSWQDALL